MGPTRAVDVAMRIDTRTRTTTDDASVVESQVCGGFASEGEDGEPACHEHEGERGDRNERDGDREVLLLRVRDGPEKTSGEHVELRRREEALHEG